MAGASSQADRLRTLMEPVAQQLGVDLEDLTVARAGSRFLVRVVVDADGGLDLDAVADVSRAASRALDDADVAGENPLPGPYVLEVSTPGVDRPLTAPRHWRRAVGRLVAASLADGHRLVGRVRSASEDADGAVVFDVAGSERTLPYAEVRRAVVQVEFGHADESGEPSAHAATAAGGGKARARSRR